MPQSTGLWHRRTRGALILLMGGLALLAPLLPGSLALLVVGWLLIASGVMEWLETFQAPEESGRRSAYLGGVLTVLAGILLLVLPQFVLGGLALLLGLSFFLDGLGKVVAAGRAWTAKTFWKGTLFRGLANLALALVLFFQFSVVSQAVVMILVGLRLLATGWPLLLGRMTEPGLTGGLPPAEYYPDQGLGLAPHAEIARLRAALGNQEEIRRQFDNYWFWTFVITFFAIHVGRMNAEWNLVGLSSPFVAALGDVATALVLAFGLILPFRLAWRWATRPIERRLWRQLFAGLDRGGRSGVIAWASRLWLKRRLRFSLRMAVARRSLPDSLRWGLRMGLPLTAVLIALNPIWGFSWYFNSENWATEVWNRWAEARTDSWREQMILAVQDEPGLAGLPADRLFQVEPPGVAGAGDFSFLVLGDTGEGDASQHCLRDQFLALGEKPDVKFLVVSSDVIYPAGAMKDYEPKFYLPFKGFTKPIYAIPGNHDWYDALEGFAANFLQPDAARAAMRARVVADGRMTTSTEGRLAKMIEEAARLRRQYQVSTGWQRGPFFEVQGERFALIAVDTGVLKSVDPQQGSWLKASLERARGKFVLAILGHPLYAGGHYKAGADEPFAAIHRLLREQGVPVVMAGDTHSLEYYREENSVGGETRVMHHFVNGGGGAYLSIGSPLDWADPPALAHCSFYPRTEALVAKLDSETPTWKKPLWLWTKYLGAWPLTVEGMASAFDFNRAPFFQSFIKVQVEGSRNQVRFLPYGAHGPLRWREQQTFGRVIPPGKTGGDVVEYLVPMLPFPHRP